ncbi:MAG TPA: hypothetical protein PLV32_08085, partial [Chitinophagaceae bacterium]|nr:hypothetical protein [Chitinophagaceae bacterium]
MSKVIIIDDEALARSIVKEYLQKHPQLEIVAECGDGFEGIKAIQQYQPDLYKQFGGKCFSEPIRQLHCITDQQPDR